MSYIDENDSFAADGLQVEVSDLLIATPEYCDPLLSPQVQQVLKLLRDRESMHAAFACEIVDGQRVSRRTSSQRRAQFIDEQQEPLELAFCKQVMHAQVPPGCYMSAPVMLANGAIYGTLYSFCFSPDPAVEAREIKKLEMAAQLAARLIEGQTQRPAAAPAAPARREAAYA